MAVILFLAVIIPPVSRETTGELSLRVVDLGMHPCDLQIDVFRGGPGTPVNVRITHLPTGLWAASTDVSQIRARERAKTLLAAKLPTDG